MKRFLCFVFAGMLSASTASAVIINEFEPNPPGQDPTMVDVELKGTPGASFTGNLFSIEADFDPPQFVDRAAAVSGTFDSNGLLVVQIPDLENPSFTFVLTADDATASQGDPLDINNPLSVATLGTVLDAIGVPDEVADQSRVIGAALGGADFINTNEFEIAFRDGVTDDWYGVDTFTGEVFNLAGTDVGAGNFDKDPLVTTFGDVNPTIPEPSAAVLALLALVGVAKRR